MSIQKTICECGRAMRNRPKKNIIMCGGCLRRYTFNEELEVYEFLEQMTHEYKRPPGSAGSPGDVTVTCALKSLIY